MTLQEIREKYKLTADYHTHTVYSCVGPYLHGKGSVLQNVQAAALKGLKTVAITDHGPWDFYGLKLSRIPQVREDIRKAREKFAGIRVLLGVEADIVDSPNALDVTREEQEQFDFINAGYHYVPHSRMLANWLAFRFPCPASVKEKLRQQNTERIIKALTNNKIFILTHPGDKAYIDVHAVAEACQETHTLVEINARHAHPNCEELKVFAEYDVKFAISSDAHSPGKVGRYDRSLALAFKAGIPAERIVNIK